VPDFHVRETGSNDRFRGVIANRQNTPELLINPAVGLPNFGVLIVAMKVFYIFTLHSIPPCSFNEHAPTAGMKQAHRMPMMAITNAAIPDEVKAERVFIHRKVVPLRPGEKEENRRVEENRSPAAEFGILD